MPNSNMWFDEKTRCWKWITDDGYGNDFVMCDNPFHYHGTPKITNMKLLTLRLQDTDGFKLLGDD